MGRRNIVQGLSREATTEEKTASFGAIPAHSMSGPNMIPYAPGYDVSDTSSLDKDLKENYRSKACRTWKKDKGGYEIIQTGNLSWAMPSFELRASSESNELPDCEIFCPPGVQCSGKVRLSQFIDVERDM